MLVKGQRYVVHERPTQYKQFRTYIAIKVQYIFATAQTIQLSRIERSAVAYNLS